MGRRFGAILTIAAVLFAWSAWTVVTAEAADTYSFKISLEGPPSHSKNLGVEIFVKELVAKSGGRLKPTVYHSAQLYKDIHVIKALDMGMVEMGVVGNYLLDGVDIDATVTHLPMFFGQSITREEYLKLIDQISDPICAGIEKKIKVKVIGRVFELGFDHIYTTERKITELEDFKGLKIRHPGSAISTARIEALGANGVVIAYADVAMALTQHTIDGVSTTTKSVESAKLNEAGLKYCVETRNYFTHYFPLVNLRFWNSLPPDLQKIFVEVWEDTVPKQRDLAAKEQQDAKDYLESKGMEFYTPSPEKLAQWRNHIMVVQDKLIEEFKYDPELVKQCKKALGM